MKPWCNYSLYGRIGLAAVAFSVTTHAFAEITGFVLKSSRAMGSVHGKAYREIQGILEGIAPDGSYSVPVTLAFPVTLSDYSGFALLDIVNTVTIGDPNFIPGGQVFPVGRLHIGEEYLLGAGDLYVSALWDKKAAELLNVGKIASLSDAIEILRDAARLARDPTLAKLPPQLAPPRGAGEVIAYGFSQSGSLLRAWYYGHLNEGEDGSAFDGAVIAGAGGGCRNMQTGEWYVCEGSLSDGGRVISVSTEADAEWGAFYERGQTLDYRAYEVAGVSHIPAANVDFRATGLPTQNPADFRPVVRAAYANLRDWLMGTEPPSSVYITLKEGPEGSLLGGPYREALRDGDGNALGGIRLPHMPREEGGGAPLGSYTGLDLAQQENAYFLISGTFKPFTPEELRARYPSKEAYVAAVTAAANDLARAHHILQKDAKAYIDAARSVDF